MIETITTGTLQGIICLHSDDSLSEELRNYLTHWGFTHIREDKDGISFSYEVDEYWDNILSYRDDEAVLGDSLYCLIRAKEDFLSVLNKKADYLYNLLDNIMLHLEVSNIIIEED